jgi:hypothetical protein
MPELAAYCKQASNSPDVRQARVFREYIIQTLLGMKKGESLWNETRALYFANDLATL